MAWRMNSCVCVRGCLNDFPTILCMLPTWSRRLVQCIPSAYLETTLDLPHKMLPVERQDRKMATVTATNGTTWTCSIDGRDRCNIPTLRPLESSPVCACLKPCSPSLCSCGSHGFRVFKHFDISTMEDGLCTLSGYASRIAWSATACKEGTTPCNADERIMDFESRNKNCLPWAIGTILATSGCVPCPSNDPCNKENAFTSIGAAVEHPSCSAFRKMRPSRNATRPWTFRGKSAREFCGQRMCRD